MCIYPLIDEWKKKTKNKLLISKKNFSERAFGHGVLKQ